MMYYVSQPHSILPVLASPCEVVLRVSVSPSCAWFCSNKVYPFHCPCLAYTSINFTQAINALSFRYYRHSICLTLVGSRGSFGILETVGEQIYDIRCGDLFFRLDVGVVCVSTNQAKKQICLGVSDTRIPACCDSNHERVARLLFSELTYAWLAHECFTVVLLLQCSRVDNDDCAPFLVFFPTFVFVTQYRCEDQGWLGIC